MVTELKIVGGNPALDLVNTVGDDRVADPLDSYASFAVWAARIGVVDDAGRLEQRGRDAERTLAEARALRAVVDAVFRPLATGGEPAPGALADLAARAGAAVERARIVRAAGGYRLAWDRDPLAPLATAALDLLRTGPLDRLKACEDCPWLFLDTSRNRSRRWCTMDDCGSRSKMRRYRARRATAGR